MNPLLKDAFDLHVHSAPDVMPRKFDDIDMAQRIIASGMKGYLIKSHYFNTSQRASLIRKMYPGCDAYGTICLNNAVGGINPMAVEMAARAEAKLVWFPTVDSKNEQDLLGTIPPEKRGYWTKIQDQMRAEGITSPSINILENGKLTKDTIAVLDIIARYNMVLATGHISKAEAFALVKAAKEHKVKRIVITHVTFPSTIYTIAEQKEFLKFGAFMEHCFTTLSTNKISWETVFEQVQAIGPEHIVLGTDLGQPNALYPDEGFTVFIEKFLQNGFSENDVRTMLVKNPLSLIY